MGEPVIKSTADFLDLRERAPEYLGDLMDHVIEVLTEGGIPPDRAAVFALAVALRLRPRWAKQTIYFAEGRSIDVRLQNHRVWAEFTGRNYQELAVKYGFSEVYVRRIIDAMRAEVQARNQGQLDLS